MTDRAQVERGLLDSALAAERQQLRREHELDSAQITELTGIEGTSPRALTHDEKLAARDQAQIEKLASKDERPRVFGTPGSRNWKVSTKAAELWDKKSLSQRTSIGGSIKLKKRKKKLKKKKKKTRKSLHLK